MSTGIPRIMEFPQDGRFWRIDWFGAVEQNPHIPSEPYIQIIVSPFVSNHDIHSNSNYLASTKLTKYDEQISIRIGVGQLPFITIGSFWKNGYCQPVKAGKIAQFNNLAVDSGTASLIKGNHKEGNANLIPYSAYRTGKGFMANMVAIECDGDPYKILIPSVEVIRFYYAVSTDMAHVIFSGDLKHQQANIVNPEKCGFIPEDHRCVVHLRQHLSDEDGWVLGRILSSDEAWNGATMPHDSMMRNRMNSKFCHPESNFPFCGTTNLTARGKFYKHNDQWRFLVFAIEYCTAKFPFDNITVGRDNDNTQTEDEHESGSKKKTAFPNQSKESDGNKPFQSQQEPDSGKTSEHIELPSNRFGDITGKRIERPEKDECHYESGLKHLPKSEQSKTLGTGKGNDTQSNSGRGSANQKRMRQQALPASFEVFKEAIRLLNQVEGIQASIRPVEEAIEFVPLLKPSGKRQWSYLDSSKFLRRQVIVGNIFSNGQHYTVAEVEVRKTERLTVALLRKENGEYLSNLTLNQLLFKTALNKGVWAKANGTIQVMPMKHTWSAAKQFAISIASRLITHG